MEKTGRLEEKRGGGGMLLGGNRQLGGGGGNMRRRRRNRQLVTWSDAGPPAAPRPPSRDTIKGKRGKMEPRITGKFHHFHPEYRHWGPAISFGWVVSYLCRLEPRKPAASLSFIDSSPLWSWQNGKVAGARVARARVAAALVEPSRDPDRPESWEPLSKRTLQAGTV